MAVELGLPCETTWQQVIGATKSFPGPVVTDSLEHELAVSILQIPDVIATTVEHLAPHLLCDHVFGLAQKFHSFYSSCRIVGDPRLHQRAVLCAATDAALRVCFQLLGVFAPDKL